MAPTLCGQAGVARAARPAPLGAGGTLGENGGPRGHSVPLVGAAGGILSRTLPWGRCLEF